MSRRKQSNPKPLKSESHDKLPAVTTGTSGSRERDFQSPNAAGGTTTGSTAEEFAKKGEDKEWSNSMTVASDHKEDLEEPPSKSPKLVEDTEKKKVKSEAETAPQPPKIRLKSSLATDPALQTPPVVSIKEEDSAEYLSLPPALQALASKGLFLPSALKHAELQARAAENQPPAAAVVQPLYVCPPCNIRFSSMSTLEAHQTYYCSFRANQKTEDEKSTNGDASGNQSEQDSSETAAKSTKTGKQYTCAHCSYSADKKVSLNRHMRMHTTSPNPSNVAINIPPANGEASNIETQDRYCAQCDIRFSSQKTYRAHKAHYCSSRHLVKAVPATKASSCNSGSTPTSPVDTNTCRSPTSPTSAAVQQQPLFALPTNPIIIVPYSLLRGASLLPGILPNISGLPSPDTPCFLLPNGTLQPMTQPLSTTATLSPGTTTTEVLKSTNKTKEANVKNDSAPLDLTVRKTPEPKDIRDKHYEQEKENIKQYNPEKDSNASTRTSPPATPSSHHSTSPKRKHEDITSRSNSPRVSSRPKSSDLDRLQSSPDGNSAPFGIPNLPSLIRSGTLPILPPEVQLRLATSGGDLAALPPAAPQILVKQGVSKCKECNIVFYKHENYLIHKKHYCSARLVDDEASKTSGSPPVSPGSAGASSPAAPAYQQLICMACGIKFTSIDNLNAHQAYYCLKRGDVDVRRCGKCRTVAEPGHQCAAVQGPVSGWKCPCCDVVSVTASAAQKHMESHAGVKAYRCTICGYKGNTLRGMRTHIRVHFDKRSPDLQEEKYISYILDDEGSNVEVNLLPATDDRSISPSSEGRVEALHHCTSCSYTSMNKSHVIRHAKMKHSQAMDIHPSNGIEEKVAESPHSNTTEEEDVVVIKKEAIEPEIIIAPVDEIVKKDLDIKSDQISEEDAEILQEAAKLGPKYCKSCDIKFTYYNTFIAHKKYYCSSHAGEVTANTTNNNNATTRTAEASVL